MGDFFGAFKGLVRGGIDVLLTPIRSRKKRARPSEVVDEVVPNREEGRPAKRRLAMSDDELVRARRPSPTPSLRRSGTCFPAVDAAQRGGTEPVSRSVAG